jgi:hypothetical protein
MRHLRTILAQLLIAILLSTLALGQQHRDLPYHALALDFVVMGDPQPEEPPELQPECFREILRDMRALRPDAIMIVGDLIRGFTDDSLMLKREWEGFQTTVAGIPSPLLYAPGNHDIWDETSQNAWRKSMGALYTSCTMGPVHFILLDCYELGKFNRITEDQLAWLKADLDSHRNARHIFIGVHAPIWAYGQWSNWMEDVHPLLRQYNVRAVFAGHWHLYERSGVVDGIRYYVTGGAGGLMGEEADETGEFHHYMHVTVRDDSVSYAVMRPGSVLDDGVVTKESSSLALKVRDEVIGDARLEFSDTALVSREITVPVVNTFHERLQGTAQWRFSRPILTLQMYDAAFSLAPGEKTLLKFRITGGTDVSIGSVYRYRPLLLFSLARQDSLPAMKVEKELVVVRNAAGRRAPGGLRIDGELGEWGSSWPLQVKSRSQVSLVPERWSGPEDVSGEFAVAFGDSELFFAGTVRDSHILHASRKEEPYQGDAVSLYLDLRGPEDFQKRVFTNGVYLLIFVPESDKKEEAYYQTIYPYGRQLKRIRYASKRVQDGYTVEASVPYAELSLLPVSGRTIGVDVCIDDLEPAGTRLRMLWNGIWANFMYANRYGRLRIP